MVKIIGIAGRSGCGKTTFLKKIKNMLCSLKLEVISMDNFYIGRKKMNNLGIKSFDIPQAFDWKLYYEFLKNARLGKEVKIPIYDFKKQEVIGIKKMEISSNSFLLIEGLYTFYYEELLQFFDKKIFVESSFLVALYRRLIRDKKERGKNYIQNLLQYLMDTEINYQRYVKKQKKFADVVLNVNKNNKMVELLCHFLKIFF